MKNYGFLATRVVGARSDKASAPQNTVRLLKTWVNVKKKQGMIQGPEDPSQPMASWSQEWRWRQVFKLADLDFTASLKTCGHQAVNLGPSSSVPSAGVTLQSVLTFFIT